MAVDCQNDVANAAAERRAPQHGLFAQRAREQDAVKVRAVARLDALGEHGDDEPVAMPALVVKRAQLPDDAKALSLLHRADAQQCLARHDDGHVVLARQALDLQGKFVEPAGMVLVRKDGLACGDAPQLHIVLVALHIVHLSTVLLVYPMKKNVEICRAEHEEKKEEPSFDGSSFN